MKFLKVLNEKIEIWLINVFLANIVFWVFLQVILRYVFNNSLSWSEEFVRWCFIWFIWIGVSYGFKTKAHISVTVFVNLLPVKAQKIIHILINLIVFWCMVKFTIYGYEQILTPIVAKQQSVVLYYPFTEIRVGVKWLYISLVVGAFLSAFRLLQNIYDDIQTFKKGGIL
ncbi:TRAP transporter small permease [Conservatibacter flavescens]|uniref:TRAP transporter small permease protein n=2 Tax=Conservatibacter flavescens TaxID=28161 RepID=A0A2M8S597_9PAST|nr:TRAP transporter small permease [Conservatibacter flavescens]